MVCIRGFMRGCIESQGDGRVCTRGCMRGYIESQSDGRVCMGGCIESQGDGRVCTRGCIESQSDGRVRGCIESQSDGRGELPQVCVYTLVPKVVEQNIKHLLESTYYIPKTLTHQSPPNIIYMGCTIIIIYTPHISAMVYIFIRAFL